MGHRMKRRRIPNKNRKSKIELETRRGKQITVLAPSGCSITPAGFCLRRLSTTPSNQLVQHDHRHQPDDDDKQRRHRRPGQLFVCCELKRARRQRVEVEGAENQCEGKLLENVDEDEQPRTDQGAAEQG